MEMQKVSRACRKMARKMNCMREGFEAPHDPALSSPLTSTAQPSLTRTPASSTGHGRGASTSHLLDTDDDDNGGGGQFQLSQHSVGGSQMPDAPLPQTQSQYDAGAVRIIAQLVSHIEDLHFTSFNDYLLQNCSLYRVPVAPLPARHRRSTTMQMQYVSLLKSCRI